MIDNFEQIKKLLSFNNDDEFYYCQVLKRKKENSELGSNSHVVKTYFIKSLEELDKEKGEMILLSNYHNARVYINLNKRSFETTCFHTLKKITDQILAKDYKQAREAYNSVCGMIGSDKNKTWVVDIDEEQVSPIMLSFIEYQCAPIYPIKFDAAGMITDFQSKIIATIKTKNGWHLITKPFKRDTFEEKYPSIDIHSNNPTLLYVS